jgi:uncharacterized protein (TIGR03032 family)
LAATDVEAGWRAASDCSGILIDVRKGMIIRSGPCMPHSPRIIDNRLYVLNGGEGELLRIDRETGASVVVTRLPGFTHGLCAHAGILFVGMSQNRVSCKDNPPPVTRRLSSLIAGVTAIDQQSGRTLGTLEDVKPLAGVRRASMWDLLAADGYVGVETPDSVFWTTERQDRAGT